MLCLETSNSQETPSIHVSIQRGSPPGKISFGWSYWSEALFGWISFRKEGDVVTRKQKLSLEQLRVSSYVTSEQKTSQIAGGQTTGDDSYHFGCRTTEILICTS